MSQLLVGRDVLWLSRRRTSTAICGCLFVLLACSSANPSPPSELQADIDRIFRPLVDPQVGLESRYVGVIVGTIRGNDHHIACYGLSSLSGPGQIAQDTIFCIGSMTKVFTALLLADLVVQDKLRLDARLADFMPTGAAATEYEGSAITLLHLATHRSGLPSMPSNNPSPKSDPFSRYTARMLYGFLEMHTLRARPGTAYEYSNLGSALLGHAIERMEKTTYESLVRDRICGPLGLRDTTTYLNEQQSGRLARSYRDGRAVGVWHFDVLVPCGGLHSTMHDMIAFTKANMGALRTTLSPAMERMQTEVPGPGPDDKTAMGLTWRINRRTGIVWHAGLVHGNQTFVAFDRTNQTGIVILSNTYHSTGEALKLGGFKAMSVLRRPATK